LTFDLTSDQEELLKNRKQEEPFRRLKAREDQ